MSLHSFSVCWLHIVFATLNRDRIIHKDLRILLSNYFRDYSMEKNIYHRINFVNAEHVHLLIDLPTNLTIEDAVKLFKGSSSFWINKNNYVNGKFSWQRGYGAFAVSPTNVDIISAYIARQEEHHKTTTFQEEYEKLMRQFYRQKNNFKVNQTDSNDQQDLPLAPEFDQDSSDSND
jgi:putative transposase